MNEQCQSQDQDITFAMRLFGVYNGTGDSEKTRHEWSTLYPCQREQWLALSKWIGENTSVNAYSQISTII
jgi:hypothetical protein